MRNALIGMLAVTLAGALPAHAADDAAIKEKVAVCAGCHGENGISQTENIPSLAGQTDQYIQWQLVFFRAGSRKNEQMQPIVEGLSNEDIRNLGAYFAALTPPKAPKDDNSDLSKKGAQAAVHSAACGAPESGHVHSRTARLLHHRHARPMPTTTRSAPS